jgi:ArsR family transcriptional regulator, arsenate/arsenite/antimonite-responsive transcriptional repressor
MENKIAIKIFMALGQESRLNVFRLIVQKGDVGVTPKIMVETLGIPNATLSFHLKELLQANLIEVERMSRHLVYKPNPTIIHELGSFLMENCCGGVSCIQEAPILISNKKSDHETL